MLNEILPQMTIHGSNTFCFDNGAVEYLLRYKHDAGALRSEKGIYAAKNWELSVKSTVSLFRYISTLPPCKVTDVGSIGVTRRTIEHLADPLVKTAYCIANNMRLTIRKLCHGRTVCTHSDCVRVVAGQIAYTQICHEKCIEKLPMRCCPAFIPFHRCRRRECGHSVYDHKWENFEYEVEGESEVDGARNDQALMIEIAAKLSVFSRKNVIWRSSNVDYFSDSLEKRWQQ